VITLGRLVSPWLGPAPFAEPSSNAARKGKITARLDCLAYHRSRGTGEWFRSLPLRNLEFSSGQNRLESYFLPFGGPTDFVALAICNRSCRRVQTVREFPEPTCVRPSREVCVRWLLPVSGRWPSNFSYATAVPCRLSLQPRAPGISPGEARAAYLHILRMEDVWSGVPFPSPVAAHKPPASQVRVLK
jgi:hypothetical protein